ncbi:MAG TPA: tRNA (guanosine(37)-N1)-methyltransferase TrmD [Candidatus Paceibacterota bacterium]|nr:tRNA (guanosine(37)-N1)-methyltransferase TrmD [Candidatus Paceibacterota bacterium]
MINFHIITLFPETIEAYTNASILGRAQKEKLLTVKTYQLRDFVTNKWGKVDERPYGGGPGMIIQAEPVIRAVEAIQKKIHTSTSRKTLSSGKKIKVLITAAGGKPLTNAYAKSLAKYDNVVIICGRYEGIDSRAKKALKAEEVSVGPYILTGGEVPALAIIDATARQIKGVLGKFESLEESRVASHEIYTRPEILKIKDARGKEKSYRVPKVLLSGHHAKIDAHRSKKLSKPL